VWLTWDTLPMHINGRMVVANTSHLTGRNTFILTHQELLDRESCSMNGDCSASPPHFRWLLRMRMLVTPSEPVRVGDMEVKHERENLHTGYIYIF
jgi:hypothetical protein